MTFCKFVEQFFHSINKYLETHIASFPDSIPQGCYLGMRLIHVFHTALLLNKSYILLVLAHTQTRPVLIIPATEYVCKHVLF